MPATHDTHGPAAPAGTPHGDALAAHVRATQPPAVLTSADVEATTRARHTPVGPYSTPDSRLDDWPDGIVTRAAALHATTDRATLNSLTSHPRSRA